MIWLVVLAVILLVVIIVAVMRPGGIFQPKNREAEGPTSFNLRIGTYNVAMLPPAYQEASDADLVEKAKRIAEKINRSGYDIICLNELFWGEAQDVFVDTLYKKGPYRHCAWDINQGKLLDVDQDSGLAIFSKWPFEKLPPMVSGDEDWLDQGYTAKSDGKKWKHLAFRSFEDEKKIDSWAGKGIAYVVVRHPQGHSRYHIFFTHLNDDLGTDELDDVKKDKKLHDSQLGEIAEFMEYFITPEIFSKENVFLLGDFNIDGNPRNFHFVADSAAPDPKAEAAAVEEGKLLLSIWKDQFATSGQFFTDKMWDCHFWESPQPPIWVGSGWGKRNEKLEAKFDDGHAKQNRRRLDFFLRNAPTYTTRDALWVQHMTRGFHLRDQPPFEEAGPEWNGVLAGHGDLSDHYAVAVDLNRVNDHCSPLDEAAFQDLIGSGRVKPLSSTGLASAAVRVLADKDVDPVLADATPGDDWIFKGRIADPGAMQWLRIDRGGTYSVGFTAGDDKLQYRIYAQSDFTVPIPQYRDKFYTNGLTEPVIQIPTKAHGPQETVPFTGKTHHVPEPPFYIRVFHRDRAFTGDYTLRIHRHGCTSEQDICYLEPFVVEQHSFASDANLTASTDAWFGIDLEALDSGETQHLHFWADCSTEPLAALALSDIGEPAFSQVSAIAGASPERSPWNLDKKSLDLRHLLHVEHDLGGPRELRMVVSRADPGPTPAPLDFEVGWMTNLTVLYDDPARQLLLECTWQEDITFDDHIALSCNADGIVKLGKTDLGKFDDGQPKPLIPLIPQAFPIRFTKQVDFTLHELDVEGDDLCTNSVAALGAGPEVTDLRTLAKPVNFDVLFYYPKSGLASLAYEDGEYHLYGRLSHGMQWKKG
jgi:hypothetical protein